MLPLILALLAATPRGALATQKSPLRCEYDPHVLDLGFDAFDQDMKGGWRALADQRGCEDRAADLVKRYRQNYLSLMPLLYWHEAQLRATLGEYKEAIVLMEHSRKPKSADLSGWNPYVDASISFLRHDRNGFLEAQSRLKHLQKPNGWPAGEEWPQNASVVAGLWNCFGKAYKTAYDAACRPMGKRPL